MTAAYPAEKDHPAVPMGAVYAGHPPMSRVRFPSGHEGWLVTPEEVAQARQDGFDDMAALVAVKREQPADDFLSALVHARDEDGDRLTEAELVDLATQLLLAGHETTVSLIATGVVLLCRHPGQLAALREDPELAAGAVEEIMRFDGPADSSLLRVALEDVALGGVTVRRGEAVLAFPGAANRDENVFPDAGRFDIRREDAVQLGFGHGIHFCLGAALARLEGEIALRTLVDRLPGLELAVAPETIAWRPPLSVRGPEEVPATWSA